MDSDTEDCRKYAVRYYNIITNVGGRICRSVMLHGLEVKHKKSLSDYLKDNKSKIEDKRFNTNMLNKAQYDKLYPKSKAALNAEDFDITLLMFLFINFIFAETKGGELLPNYKLLKSLNEIRECDKSVIDDLARVRCFQNKVHDITDTAISLKEDDFWKNVTKITEIFIRLEKYYTKNGIVVKSIDKELHAKLNLEGEVIEESDVEKALQKIQFELEHSKEMENEIWKLLHTDRRFEDVKVDLPKNVFVKTKPYEKAKDTLDKRNIIVLNGSPGEGKTIVAKMLLKDVSKERCIKISTAKDMKMIGNDVDAVLIDDMFGSSTFDMEMFRQWQNNLDLISDWVKIEGKKRYVVITSRTYILNEAKQKLFIKELFCEDNIIQLSSEQLNTNEKLSILQNHFIDVDLNSFYSKQNKKKRQRKHNCLLKQFSELESKTSTAAFTVGFPECARLFSCNKELYSTGKSFFEAPMEEIKNNISELCQNDEIFVAFLFYGLRKDNLSS